MAMKSIIDVEFYRERGGQSHYESFGYRKPDKAEDIADCMTCIVPGECNEWHVLCKRRPMGNKSKEAQYNKRLVFALMRDGLIRTPQEVNERIDDKSMNIQAANAALRNLVKDKVMRTLDGGRYRVAPEYQTQRENPE